MYTIGQVIAGMVIAFIAVAIPVAFLWLCKVLMDIVFDIVEIYYDWKFRKDVRRARNRP